MKKIWPRVVNMRNLPSSMPRTWLPRVRFIPLTDLEETTFAGTEFGRSVAVDEDQFRNFI